MSSFRFTKRTVDAIEPPTDGQVLYRDTLLRGFGPRFAEFAASDPTCTAMNVGRPSATR